MIDNSVRDLLYSFGYIANVAFTARFLLQWFLSEKKGKSVTPKMFWQISLMGNLFLCIHSWIQLQFHVCAISACNGVIAWRNLNIMKYSFKQTLGVFVGVLLIVILAFYLASPEGQWFRIPLSNVQSLHPLWHLLGVTGLILFSLRFWVQWWHAEMQKESQLTPLFWWFSLAGGSISVVYFMYIGDLVNAIGPGFGTIPYLRNLMLIYRKEVESCKM